jgi:1-acyl-sn-glycerol-3-phosphate acyltransferase
MLYAFIRGLGRLIFYFLGLKVEGLSNLPSTGAVIIAANHVSNWDPVVIALALDRPIHFMGKSELFKCEILGKFITKLNAFPVRKDVPDRQAIKKALQVLAEGQVLGIFPEGGRNFTGDMKAQPGVVLLALKSGAPIVPVGCMGTNHRLPLGWFHPLLVRVGEPFYLRKIEDQKSKSAVMEQLSTDIMNKINSLLNK